MADAITWYALGRIVGDPESIMEAIDEKLVAHNADTSAHGLADEAVHIHRTNEALDHPQYSVYNIKMAPSTRPVKAFCDVGGAADFGILQEAVDYTHQHGGGVISVKAGVYYLTSDLTLYSNIHLIGEDVENTIIDLSGAGGRDCVKVTGSVPGVAGVSTLTVHSDQVVGVGSNYEHLQAGDYLIIGGHAFGQPYLAVEIASIADDTHLTLVSEWEGSETLVGVAVGAYRLIDNVSIENVTIRNAQMQYNAGRCLQVNHSAFCHFENVKLLNSEKYGMEIGNSWSVTLDRVVSTGNNDAGFRIFSDFNCEIRDCLAFLNLGSGFIIDHYHNSSLTDCFSLRNGGDGFEGPRLIDSSIIGCKGEKNAYSGLNMSDHCYHTMVTGNSFRGNNLYGILISDQNTSACAIGFNTAFGNLYGSIANLSPWPNMIIEHNIEGGEIF